MVAGAWLCHGWSHLEADSGGIGQSEVVSGCMVFVEPICGLCHTGLRGSRWPYVLCLPCSIYSCQMYVVPQERRSHSMVSNKSLCGHAHGQVRLVAFSFSCSIACVSKIGQLSLMTMDVPPPKGPLFIFGDPLLRKCPTGQGL